MKTQNEIYQKLIDNLLNKIEHIENKHNNSRVVYEKNNLFFINSYDEYHFNTLEEALIAKLFIMNGNTKLENITEKFNQIKEIIKYEKD